MMGRRYLSDEWWSFLETRPDDHIDNDSPSDRTQGLIDAFEERVIHLMYYSDDEIWPDDEDQLADDDDQDVVYRVYAEMSDHGVGLWDGTWSGKWVEPLRELALMDRRLIWLHSLLSGECAEEGRLETASIEATSDEMGITVLFRGPNAGRTADHLGGSIAGTRFEGVPNFQYATAQLFDAPASTSLVEAYTEEMKKYWNDTLDNITKELDAYGIPWSEQ